MSIWRRIYEACGADDMDEATGGRGKSGDPRHPVDPEEAPPSEPMSPSRASRYDHDPPDRNRKRSRRDHSIGDVEEAPVEVPGLDIGAGVRTQFGQAGAQQIKLTIGDKRLSFSPEEFVEMIESGDIQRMVQGGQVRKLPGVG